MAEALCPSCAALNPSSQRFCGQCGALLARACEACGAENPPSNRFCGSCGASLDARPPATPGDERRWATIVFADVAGFTSLAEAMDPEDVKALAARCSERMGEEVHRFGGTVISVFGDALMATFGAPFVHEDDAERALRSALAMLESVKSIEAPRTLELHVGINTGEVMAGRVGPDTRRDYSAMGDTTNTAARLMSAAPPGSVYVGEETWRATRQVAEYSEVGEISVKGKERPLRVWRALSIARIPASRPLGTAPLVGRERELGLLVDLWKTVSREARPYLVTVLGEPGVGKTRLVWEFERRALRDATVLHGRCPPHGEALGYGAFAAALKEAAGIAADEPADTAREKLERLVSEALGPEGEATEIAGHVARLAGLGVEPRPGEATPDQRTLRASARRFLEALARRHPTCLVFDDIHWAEDSLLDLIEFVASRAGEVPLLIVAQARPGLLEARPTWGGGVRAFASLPLEPLGGGASRDLATVLCREHRLSEEFAERISRQSEGNPLFAEELVAMVTERGAISGIPSSIKALISARLDTLPAEERACFQHASIFGKVFWEKGVGALGVADVPEALEALARKGLLRAEPRSQFRGDCEYSFKHDLIRDVAYETLPRARRRELHGRAADWLEQAAGERVEELYDGLAHHALEADQSERALGYLDRAAEHSRRAAAHREEAVLLARAIELARKLGRAEVVPELQARRGRAFVAVAMWSDARRELEAALEGLPVAALARRAEVCSDLSAATFWALDVPSIGRYAADALRLAEEVGRDDLAAIALGWLGGASGAMGNLAPMLDYYHQGLARAGGAYVSSLGMYPLALWWVGRFEEAGDLARVATAEARKAGDTLFTMYSLPHMGLSLASSGRYADAARVFEEARVYGREHGIGPMLARATAMSAGLHLDVFDYAGAEAIQQEARELGRTHGFAPAVVSASIDLMLNLARRGDPAGAERLVAEVGEAIAKASGWHGWLWRLRLAEARAETALARGDADEAIDLATDALEQSRGKRPKYEVLALTTRGCALAQAGRVREAIADSRSAVAGARSLGDPAVLLRALGTLLELEVDDALATEARAAAERISAALPDDLRRLFEDAAPVRALERPS